MTRQASTSCESVKRRARLLPLVALAVLAVACGSTVQVGQNGLPLAGEVSQDGLALGGQVEGGGVADPAQAPIGASGDTSGGVSGESGLAGTGTSGAGSITPGGTSSGGGSGGAGAPGSGGPQAGSPRTDPGSQSGGTSPRPSAPRSGNGGGSIGPGVTAKEIVVGVGMADESNNNAALLGVSNLTQGDRERYYEIMRDQINREGGIAGRKVRYSFFRYSTAQGARVSGLENEACEYWSRDNRAYVVRFTSSQNFLACARQNQLATTAEGLTSSDDTTFATFPHHFEPSSMSLTQQMAILPQGLVAQKYFDRGYKLGVITFESTNFVRAVEGTLRPALGRYGVKITGQVQKVSAVEENEDLAEITAQVQSAVLRFKTEGITHVLIVDERGLLTLLFTRSAENQDFHPRYGTTSQNGHTALAGAVPEGQFNRAVGIGWMPTFDVVAKERPRSEAGQRCLAMFKRKGEEPADPNNAAVMVGVCEELRFIKAAVERGLPDITMDSFKRGGEGLGSSFPSFEGMANASFGPGRHAGVRSYRHVRYDAGCKCFHYTSKLIGIR